MIAAPSPSTDDRRARGDPRPASQLPPLLLLLAGIAAAGLLEGLLGVLDDGGRTARAGAPALLAYAAATWFVPALACALVAVVVAIPAADVARSGAGFAAGGAAALFAALALVLDGRGPLAAALGGLVAAFVVARALPAALGRRPWRRALLSWALLGAAWWTSGAALGRGERLADDAGARAGRPLVVLVVADALRRDALSCYGSGHRTPRLDGLAADGWRVDDALSSSSWTLPAVSTLFSGCSPRRHGVTDHDGVLPQPLPLLATALSDAGMLTGAVVGNPIVRADRGFLRGFDALRGHPHEVEAGFFWIVRLDRWLRATGRHSGPNAGKKLVLPWLDGLLLGSRRTGYLAADEVTDAALAFVDELDGRDGMLYVHYFDPHDPYLPHPSRPWDAEPAFDDASRGSLVRRYEAEVAFLDAQVGRLLDGLAARGRLDDALIVFSADHGEEFGDHGGFRHGATLYGELVEVPLLVRFPRGTTPGPAPRTASLADVAPSILAWLGLPPLPGAEGRVLAGAATDVPRFAERVQEGVRLVAVRDAGEHAVARFPEAFPPTHGTLLRWDGWEPLALEPFADARDAWRVPPGEDDRRVDDDALVLGDDAHRLDDRRLGIEARIARQGSSWQGGRPERDAPLAARSAPFVVPRDGLLAARVDVAFTGSRQVPTDGPVSLRLFVEEKVALGAGASGGADGRVTLDGWRLVPGSAALVPIGEHDVGTAPVPVVAGRSYRVGAQVLGGLLPDLGESFRVGVPRLLLDAPDACVELLRFDLVRDRRMRAPLAHDEPAPDGAARRRAAFEAIVGYLRRRGLVETRVLDDDELERLRAIGYVGDGR